MPFYRSPAAAGIYVDFVKIAAATRANFTLLALALKHAHSYHWHRLHDKTPRKKMGIRQLCPLRGGEWSHYCDKRSRMLSGAMHIEDVDWSHAQKALEEWISRVKKVFPFAGSPRVSKQFDCDMCESGASLWATAIVDFDPEDANIVREVRNLGYVSVGDGARQADFSCRVIRGWSGFRDEQSGLKQ